MAVKKRLSNNKKRKLKQLVEQAYRLSNQRNLQPWMQACAEIEALQPNNPDLANLRGVAAYHAGHHDAAKKYFHQAIEAAPKRADLILTLANFYLVQNYSKQAASYFKQAYDLGERGFDTLLSYGQCLIFEDAKVDALAILKKAETLVPYNEELCFTLYRAYFGLGRLDDAEKSLKNILNNNPTSARALLGMGQISLQHVEFAAAKDYAHQALANDSNFVDAYILLCDVKKFNDPQDQDILHMQELLKETDKDLPHFHILSTALAKALHQTQQYDEAFHVVHTSKEHIFQNSCYRPEEELAHLQYIIETFSEDDAQTNSGYVDDTPIFVVGMPRCGSTLTEQILTSHPDIQSVGESDFIMKSMLEIADDPNTFSLQTFLNFPPDMWRKFADVYLKHIRKQHPTSPHIVDKQLENIRHIGSIYKAFPNAKVIHVQRQPMDIGWSIYKNNLEGGIYNYGQNLEQLGYYYRAYERLMRHWKRVLPESFLYEIQYETLVQHPQEEIPKLLDFCHVSTHEDCFNFYKSKNVAATTSSAQVRKPMYNKSIQSWKPYEKHLKVLADIVGHKL